MSFWTPKRREELRTAVEGLALSPKDAAVLLGDSRLDGPEQALDATLNRCLSTFPAEESFLQLKAALNAATTRTFRILFSSSTGPETDRVSDYLSNGLKAAGYVPRVPAPGEWARAAPVAIASCDYFVCLLSEASVQSQVLIEEVRLAWSSQIRRQRPVIVPVRLGGIPSLGYELDAYIGNAPSFDVENIRDVESLIQQVLNVIRGDTSPNAPLAPAHAVPVMSRNAMDVGPRTGPLHLDDALYVARPADGDIDKLLTVPSQVVVLSAPPQHGKTSLLVRCVERGRKIGRRMAFIDLSVFGGAELESYGSFLSTLARSIQRSLEVASTRALDSWKPYDLEDFVADTLASSQDDVTLVLDAVDSVVGRPYQNDFFAMLRGWHNNRSSPVNPEWRRLSMVLAISKEPFVLTTTTDQSPFNVGVSIDLAPFTVIDCATLNQRYGAKLSASDVTRLQELIGGHPQLAQLAFHHLARGTTDIEHLGRRPDDVNGPFGGYLRRLLSRIVNDEDLLGAAKQFFRKGSIGPLGAARLRGAGLIRQERDRSRPANMVYARFFSWALEKL